MTELTQDQENFLKRAYFTPTNSAAFSGLEKFYRFVRNKRKDIPKTVVRQWLQNQPSYSLFKSVQKKFKRPKVISPFRGYLVDADTAHFTQFANENDGYKYIAVFIDVLSHYLYTFPMKTLKSQEMKKVLTELFHHIKPYMIRSDRGGEFQGLSKAYLKDMNVKFLTTSEHSKANYAERVIRTIRLKIARYMKHNHTVRWVDVLPDITKSYNNTYHRSIKMTPAEALVADEVLMWKVQYEPELLKVKPTKNKKFAFNVGDVVRIVKLTKAFDKESQPKWTEELFSVVSRTKNQGIPKYTLKDFNNEPILDSFMEPELQKVEITGDSTYDIEKIIRKRTLKGKKQVLVRWKGWGPKFDSWIDETEVKNFE